MYLVFQNVKNRLNFTQKQVINTVGDRWTFYEYYVSGPRQISAAANSAIVYSYSAANIFSYPGDLFICTNVGRYDLFRSRSQNNLNLDQRPSICLI